MSDAFGTKRRIIVDLGAHDGSDTAYYLAKGFDVVAVEASPQMVASLESRFADEIDADRLRIVPVAVADHSGTIDFHLSDEDLWASTSAAMAQRGIRGVNQRAITVPCRPLDDILKGVPIPYYVKIDVEGRDPDCVAALGRLEGLPKYVSFEADLTDTAEVSQLLDTLQYYGYKDFKLVNQAIHDRTQLPNPPLEGEYVEPHFDKHSSGPFGEETLGAWVDRRTVENQYLDVLRRQRARIEYSASGKVFGIPMSRAHRPMLKLYNSRPVTFFRHKWATARGVPVGGWFDIHCRRL